MNTTADPHASHPAGTAAPAGAIVLLFSGGLDTTLEAMDRSRTYRDIHLLTFDNGCCINVRGAVRRAEELRRVTGHAGIRHAQVDTGPLMRALLAEAEAWRDEFRSPLVFDLACKLAALSHLIVYARQHGATDISDGASVEQTQVFIQHPDFSRHIKPLVEQYGLRFVKPTRFDVGRREKIRQLKALGLAPGVPALEKVHITSQLAHQPFCLRGFVTYFFTSPLRHLPPVRRRGLPLEQACRLWDRLVPAARAFIDHALDASCPAGGARV